MPNSVIRGYVYRCTDCRGEMMIKFDEKWIITGIQTFEPHTCKRDEVGAVFTFIYLSGAVEKGPIDPLRFTSSYNE